MRILTLFRKRECVLFVDLIQLNFLILMIGFVVLMIWIVQNVVFVKFVRL